LNKRQKDGASLRDHLESVRRQTGQTPPQLEPVEAPESILYLWQYFCDLAGGRDYGEAGPKPIFWGDIKAWSELTRTNLAAWEVDVLKALDRIYLTEALKK